MAFSPIAVGFEKHRTGNVIVYFHKNEKDLDYKLLDSLIVEVGKFHTLNFKKEVKIFICKTNKEYKRYTGSSARMVTIFGNAIFISDMANDERKTNIISFNTYLLHELSHLLIYQNMTFRTAIHYPQWFLEGLAVYSSNQFGVDGYLTEREVAKEIEKGNFVQPEDWGTAFSSKGKTVKDCKVPNKYRFIYAEFGFIIDDLIKTYGKEKFILFLKESLQADDFYVLFNKTYNIDFTEYLKDFKMKIKSH